MAKTTKKQKFEKILNMTRHHGEVVVIFKDDLEYLRRRIVRKDGSCYVSYFSVSEERWTKYGASCFICDVRNKSLKQTIKLMSTHDRGMLMPVELIVKGKVIKL